MPRRLRDPAQRQPHTVDHNHVGFHAAFPALADADRALLACLGSWSAPMAAVRTKNPLHLQYPDFLGSAAVQSFLPGAGTPDRGVLFLDESVKP